MVLKIFIIFGFFCTIGCTSSIETLKNQNPEFYKKLTTDWVVVKNEKEIVETGKIRLTDEGILETSLPICGKGDRTDNHFIKASLINWSPAETDTGKFSNDAILIICKYSNQYRVNQYQTVTKSLSQNLLVLKSE